MGSEIPEIGLPELQTETVDTENHMMENTSGNTHTPKEKDEAKRIITTHNFSNAGHVHSENARQRRNVRRRGGYRHPTDMALAMIDSYYAANNVRAGPESLAVAAIHAASLKFNARETQLDLGNQYDISPSTIRAYHNDMLDLIE